MVEAKFSKHPALTLDGYHLTIEELVRIARSMGQQIRLSETAKTRMQNSRQWVEKVQKSGSPVVYGVNTGFGSKANVSIGKEKLRELQYNLIMSHSAGTGNPLPIDVVRAAMLLRANTLARGYSGIRPIVVETLLNMLEKGVTPWIPEQGSVGASGDLAPLSHMALVLCKHPTDGTDDQSGQAYWYNSRSGNWELMTGAAAMEKAGIPRLILEAKEGLALNNGTQISTALLALAYYDGIQLVKLADVAMAMSFEALLGIPAAFREEVHQLRPHPGQMRAAENIRRLVERSQLINSQPEKVQDAYSLRCHPQVMAGVRDTLEFIGNILQIEMNSTNDNPIIFPELAEESKALSSGNFHAQPVAFAADFLSIVLCAVGNIAERRIFRMSDKNLNGGLPSFLIARDGLQSGLMIAQYTAAALASENKSLAHPASIDTVPTCENQEDHVSMAPVAARKARQILENVQKIVAIEFLYATQAVDLRLEQAQKDFDPEKILGRGTAVAHRVIRDTVEFLKKDRPIYNDIDKIVRLIKSGKLLLAVEQATGTLH